MIGKQFTGRAEEMISKNRLWLIWLATIFLSGSSTCLSQHMNAKDNPCRTSGTTVEITDCFGTSLKKADSELNTYYQRVQSVVGGDELFKLKNAQRLWIQFRDANCEAEHELYLGGTAAPMVKLACLEAMTRHRTQELTVMYGWRLEKLDK